MAILDASPNFHFAGIFGQDESTSKVGKSAEAAMAAVNTRATAREAGLDMGHLFGAYSTSLLSVKQTRELHHGFHLIEVVDLLQDFFGTLRR